MRMIARLGMITAGLGLLTVATPSPAHAFCWQCGDLVCAFGFPIFHPITGSQCEAQPGVWCSVWGSCVTGANTFIKESVPTVVAGLYSGIEPAIFSYCPLSDSRTEEVVPRARGSGMIAAIRSRLSDLLS